MLRYPTFSGCYKVKKTFITFIATGNRENKYYLSHQVTWHIQGSKNQIDEVLIGSCKLSIEAEHPRSFPSFRKV